MPDRGRAALNALVTGLACIAAALLVHFVVGSMVGPFVTRIMLDAGVMIILAVSLNIVNGFTGQFSIGHAGFMAVGAYVAAGITYYSSLALFGSYQAQTGLISVGSLIFAASALVGGLAAAGAGWVVGLPSLRLRGDYLAIVTLGFGEIVRVLLQQSNPQLFSWDETRAASLKELVPPPLGGAQGFQSIPTYTSLFWVALFVAITLVFCFRLKRSSEGRAMLSIREDEIAAQAMGVNITNLKVRAFMFASFFAGVGGALYAHQLGTALRPTDAGFARSFEILIAVVLGGLGSISGAALAAVLLTVASALMIELGPWRMVLYALALILIMIFRPGGLFGVKEAWEVFGGLWRRKAVAR
ncbi:MAG: branched-chain amino acid ABC transporter permease [Phycisphaerae bacterium]|nr:branched-chain amino acid ABC transporter permease [Phycisphaerae bacterium]